ncbi:MAG: UbiA family prenyltransferase [Isosphaeraceae bacterium]
MRLKPYLQLVRLPNLFTAAADSLAGWLLVGGSLNEPGRWGLLVGASVTLYAAGIVLNDVRDFPIDLRERPGRPLPSGQVSHRLALAMVAVFFASGLGLAWLSGTPHGFPVAVGIVLAVLAYDVWLKSTPLGPQVMGLCRALNLLLGLSLSADLGGLVGWISAASYGTFVCGITWISRNEANDDQGPGPTVVAGLALQNLAIVGQAVAALIARESSTSGMRLLGLIVLGLIGVRINQSGLRAIRGPSPKTLQQAVKAGILCLVWLHVGLLLAVRGFEPALAVAVLWFPASLVGRWLAST